MMAKAKTHRARRFVLLTSLPSFLMAEIFFAALYYGIVQITQGVYFLLSLGSTAQVEANMQLFSPINIAIFLVVLGIMAIIMCLEIATIIAITTYDYYRNDHIPLQSLVRFSYGRMKSMMTLRAAPFFLFIFFFPKEHIGPKGLFSLHPPPYILDEIIKFPLYSILLFIIIGGFLYFLYRSLFVFHYIILERTTILRAFRMSSALTRKIGIKKMIWTLLKNGIWIILFTLPIVAFGIAFARYIVYTEPFFGSGILTLASGINWLMDFLLTGLPSVLFLAGLTITFIRHSGYSEQHFTTRFHFLADRPDFVPRWYTIRTILSKKYLTVLLAILLVLSPLFLRVIIGDAPPITHTPLVISHRGVLQNPRGKPFIENTIPAILQAKHQGADIIEIDVYENRDGTLILSHDPDLSRIAKVDRDIADMSDEEIRSIRLADGSHIPTLEEVLIVAKEHHIHLMIEPKTHGKERHLYTELVRLLTEYEMISTVSVHSFSLDALQTIKKLNPHISVGHIVFGGFGRFSNSPVDFFSLQETVATRAIIRDIHQHEKRVFLWTINTPENIESYMKMGVDGFITDEVPTIRRRIQKIQHITNPKMTFRILGIEVSQEDIGTIWRSLRETWQNN